MTVKLRFVELYPYEIFNWLDPMNITAWNAFPEFHNRWWDKNIIEIRKQFGKFWTEEFDKITGHFTKLEESILKDGIHHPVCIVSGIPKDDYFKCDLYLFPESQLKKKEKMLHSRVFGGSRLSIAQKHNLKVPCVVHDFSNIFEDNEEITEKNYNKYFGNNYNYASSIPRIRLRQHSHIKNGKYAMFTQETRNAQQIALKKAKERILKENDI